MLNMDKARRAMLNGQILVNNVTDPRLLAAFGQMPRELFVPKAEAATCYGERDIDLGGGRYLIRARAMAKLMQAVEVQADDLVLDIGAGCGYGAAILASLAETVVALESDANLRQRAENALALVHADNVALIDGDLRAAAPQQGPFDGSFVAASVAEVPQTWLDQLAEGGRLGVFERRGAAGRAVVYVRSDGAIGRREEFDANMPFLPGFEPAPAFSFAQ